MPGPRPKHKSGEKTNFKALSDFEDHNIFMYRSNLSYVTDARKVLLTCSSVSFTIL